MEENVYEAPKSEVSDQNTDGDLLASRWTRLFSSIVDTLIMMAVLMPIMYFTGGFDGAMEGKQPSAIYSLAMALLGIVIFFAINGNLLLKNGQTVAKKIFNIKIVDENNQVPELKTILIRYAVFMLPSQILSPFPGLMWVGQIFAIINVLFIFRADKKCIHDLAAKTSVVQC